MGSNLNFKNFVNESSSDGGGGTGSRPPGNFPLARQPSIYTMTFDEWSSMGGLGKDFGSMNMDELLKNIWNAEDAQTMAAAASTIGAQEGLKRQGSLTLPRTLSQKTVDEVWKDLSKEGGGLSGSVGANLPQTRRQQTLGEMTLEEFLVKAGAVREDTQLAAKVNDNGSFFADFSRVANNPAALGFGFQQNRMVGLSSGNNNNSNGKIALQPSNLPLNVNGVRSNQAHGQQPQQILPKQPNMGYMTQMPLQTSPAIRTGITGIGDQGIRSGLMQGGTVGMVGLGGVPTGSPSNQLSPNGMGKTNGDTSSVSPVPYVFNGGLRGRRAYGTVEKVVERRQRRMIKNRESAARSRARKQAYTVELEAEVAKLKEKNQELRKKQDEIIEMQKNQVMEMINMQQTAKKRCLRRTQTGPW